MRIDTNRLTIRDWTLEDADKAFSIYGDPEVMQYVGEGQPSASVEALRTRLGELIERDRGKDMGFWALELRQTGEVIGGALLKPLPDQSDVEVGYHLAKAYWGKGYATEAASALVAYGQTDLGLKRIVGVTYPQNRASMRVLEKAGLIHQGKSDYIGVEVELFAIVQP